LADAAIRRENLIGRQLAFSEFIYPTVGNCAIEKFMSFHNLVFLYPFFLGTPLFIGNSFLFRSIGEIGPSAFHKKEENFKRKNFIMQILFFLGGGWDRRRETKRK
jgi:hypothetical protein